jgi:non-ribosomal peptide synthetase component F
VHTVLKRVRETTLDAYAHQDVPFETIVDESDPRRDLARTPLFQVLLVLQNAPLSTLQLPGLTAQMLDVPQDTAKFDFSLYCLEESDGILVSLEYNSDLFAPSFINQLAADFQAILENGLLLPNQLLSEVRLSSSEEDRRTGYRSGVDFQEELPPMLLPRQVHKPLVETDSITEEPLATAPSTLTEQTVAVIWRKVLERADISAHQKFFEVGGNSLRLVQVFLELNALYPGKLAVVDLFTHNTIASLSCFIDRADEESSSETVVYAHEL